MTPVLSFFKEYVLELEPANSETTLDNTTNNATQPNPTLHNATKQNNNIII